MNITIKGIVTKGNNFGSKIGFPTANIMIDPIVNIEHGVYAVVVFYNGYKYNGVANIGYHPTVGVNPYLMLEVHIFDFKNVIYGDYIEVRLVEYIRAEKQLSSVNELKKNIGKDIVTAKEILE